MTKFNPRIIHVPNVDFSTKQQYTKVIKEAIDELYIESRHAAILLKLLSNYNQRIIITNKDPSPFVSSSCIYPKVIYPEREHIYGDCIVVVIPPNYTGHIDSVKPLHDYNNSNDTNKTLIWKLHNCIPLRKEIDNDTLISLKIIKMPQHFKIYFAHELIHAYHYFYQTFNDSNNEIEEAAVIYGIENITISYYENQNLKQVYITENVIRRDYGYSPRISHNFERSI